MYEASIRPEILHKLMVTCFPDFSNQLQILPPTSSDMMKVIHKLFAQKLKANDLEEILESSEIKFADIDCTINTISKYVDTMSVLDLRELLTYKVFPCDCGDLCPKRPPEVVSNNEYLDKHLECPFYHHDKDKRRLFLTFTESDDFAYKANYLKTGDSLAEIESCSKNFFESLFHPIFYKLFPCKRKYCEGSYFCPFKHSDKEKVEWDGKFLSLTNKQRDVFLKEKSAILNGYSNGTVTMPDEFSPKDPMVDK